MVSSITALTQDGSVDIELLVKLFDQSPDVAFFIKDLQGKYVAVNQPLVIRHGLERKSQVLGKRPFEICEGEYGRIPSQQDMEVLTTGEPLIDHLEMQLSRPHKAVWCFTTKLPMRDSNDQITGLIGISRDLQAPIEPEQIPSEFADTLQKFESDLQSDVTPSSLATQCNMSSQQFARMTKRVFCLTPTQLITKTRISAASRLLNESTLSVAEIAHRCGFYDHSAFTRSFRKSTGLTPSDFRSSNGGGT